MNDMTPAIQPKSDQLNADDMVAGPITVTIRDVKITPGSEQPVSILIEGTDKAYRPCKSMSRVLVAAWGADAKAYIGRSLTLYRDPTVKWGGLEVGGIRISHMSDIDGAKQLMLTATKGSRKPHKVLPLVMQQQEDGAAKWAGGFIAKLAAFADLPAVQAFEAEKAGKLAELQGARPELHANVTAALEARKAQLAPASQPSAQSGFDDDDFTAGPAPTAQPETLLDAVDQGASAQQGEDPAAAKANAIIDEIKAAGAKLDVEAIVARERVHIEAMLPGLASTIDTVKAARIAEIEASRAKEPAE